MICPECEMGKVFHPMAHVRASKNYGKSTPCPKCNGSGIANRCDSEVTSQRDTLIGDPLRTKETDPLKS